MLCVCCVHNTTWHSLVVLVSTKLINYFNILENLNFNHEGIQRHINSGLVFKLVIYRIIRGNKVKNNLFYMRAISISAEYRPIPPPINQRSSSIVCGQRIASAPTCCFPRHAIFNQNRNSQRLLDKRDHHYSTHIQSNSRFCDEQENMNSL